MTLFENEQQRTKYYWVFSCFILLVIAGCANPWKLYFFNDDFLDIPLYGIGKMGGHSIRYTSDYSFYLDYLLYKENAAGYHVTNLLLYVGNLLLAYVLLRKLAISLYKPLSIVAVISIIGLFGIYAFHSEALFWILGRTATLSFFFMLLCWLCLFKAMHKKIWLMPMAIFFLLGLFAYEAIWVFPCWLIIWYIVLPTGDEQRRKLRLPLSIIWLLFLSYLPIRAHLLGELLGEYQASDFKQLHLFTMMVKLAKLLSRSFLPPMLHPVWFAAFSGLLVVVLIVVGIAIWKSEKGNRLLLFFFLTWLVSYFPYISMGISTSGYESERYLYFPSFFLCALFVYTTLLVCNRKWQIYLLTPLLLYHLFFFYAASDAFKSNSYLSRATLVAIRKTPVHKKLVIKNLPGHNLGLPVFNYGFYNALAWLAPSRNKQNTQVLDTVRLDNRHLLIVSDTTNIAADTLFFR